MGVRLNPELQTRETVSSRRSMKDSDEPQKNDIHTKESPLPGSDGLLNSLKPKSDSDPSSINFVSDLVAPLILAHLFYWPVFVLIGAVVLQGQSYALFFIPIILSTLATIAGGAWYGWTIGKRFTNVSRFNSATDQTSRINRGRRNQILMCLFQAILFPSLFWGGCMIIGSLG